MVENYQQGITLGKKEADKKAQEIAIRVNGNDWNRGNFPENTGEKVRIENIPNIDVLYTLIKRCGPMYAHYTDKNGEGHLVVITGVSVTKNKVYTNNPWGVKGSQSFYSFKKKVAKKWWQSGQGLSLNTIYLVKFI